MNSATVLYGALVATTRIWGAVATSEIGMKSADGSNGSLRSAPFTAKAEAS